MIYYLYDYKNKGRVSKIFLLLKKGSSGETNNWIILSDYAEQVQAWKNQSSSDDSSDNIKRDQPSLQTSKQQPTMAAKTVASSKKRN